MVVIRIGALLCVFGAYSIRIRENAIVVVPRMIERKVVAQFMGEGA